MSRFLSAFRCLQLRKVTGKPVLALQFYRFVVIGILATVVHVVVALALHHIAGMPPLWANPVAFLTAWILSYSGNWLWTFEGRTAHKYSVPRYLTVSLASFGLNQFIVFIATKYFLWPFWLALLPAVIIVPVFGFAASRYWAYRDTSSDPRAV